MNTTIALKEDTYNKLMAVKHKLEKNDGVHSFDKTINYLLELEENLSGKSR